LSEEQKDTFPTPLGNVEWGEVLMWYDGPLQFIGKIGDDLYMVYLSEREETHDKWMFIPISQQRINEVLANKITLRDMFLKAEKGYIYEVTLTYKDGLEDKCVQLACEDIPEDELPKQGAYQDYHPDEEDEKDEGVNTMQKNGQMEDSVSFEEVIKVIGGTAIEIKPVPHTKINPLELPVK